MATRSTGHHASASRRIALRRAFGVKTAQALGQSSVGYQHPYAQSIADTDARKQREAAAAAASAARVNGTYGLTGNKDYDSLPDVAAARDAANAAYQEAEFYKRQPIVQRKDLATIQREQAPIKSWGDNSILRKIVGGVTGAISTGVDAIGSAALGVNNLWEGRGNFWDEQKGYWKDRIASRDDLNHEIVNNLQLQANAARHGADTVYRLGTRYLDPRKYGNSARAEQLRRSHANAWANADDAHNERALRIVNNFHDSDLRNVDKSLLGMINYGANEAVGEFAGGELATAGLGGAAGAIGKDLTRATRIVAQGAGNLATRGLSLGRQVTTGLDRAGKLVAPGARTWTQHAGGMVQRGVNAMGDVAAAPFNTLGHLATPITTGGKAAIGTVKGIGQTLHAGMVRPVKDLSALLRSPGAARYARSVASPLAEAGKAAFRPIGQAVRHPVSSGATGYVKSVASPLWEAGKAGIGRPLWNLATAPVSSVVRAATYPVRWAAGTAKAMAQAPTRGASHALNAAFGRPARDLYGLIRNGRGYVGSVASPLWDATKAAIRPRALYNYGRSVAMPMADAAKAGLLRPVWNGFRHPISSGAWRVPAYPVRWAWNTATPAGRALFSKPVFDASVAAGAYRAAANGRYGDAAGDVGMMGAYGALGPWSLPAMAGYYGYNAYANPQLDERYR